MTGLDKITERIYTDANNRANAILEEARERAIALSNEYAARADALRAEADADAKREEANLRAQAKSAMDMEKRNAIVGAQSDLVDEAFREAYAAVRAMREPETLDLLCALATNAVTASVENEKMLRDTYGEGDGEPPFEILLAARDASLAGKLLSLVRDAVAARCGSAAAERVTIAGEYAPIDGGVVVRCGNVSENLSYEAIFADLRGNIASRVAAILFEDV